ncbi:hypothetical protein BGX23_005843 [Mortierella sp. AD031]|nr:hypothetical protein BGX23_005843 [Mortierella sp. AD031]KAG0208434.1 hypothetical protein BGX33_006236 [Mortierella sp. NVP41]
MLDYPRIPHEVFARNGAFIKSFYETRSSYVLRYCTGLRWLELRRGWSTPYEQGSFFIMTPTRSEGQAIRSNPRPLSLTWDGAAQILDFEDFAQLRFLRKLSLHG